MKPTARIIRTYKNGEIQTLELFKYENGIVLHRHLLTRNTEKAELYGIFRKFWDSYYCKQEIMLLNDDIVTLVELMEDLEK